MIYIGNHVSISKGYLAMAEHEKELGGNTFAFFTRNPRGGASKAIKEGETEQLLSRLKENNFGPLVAHAPYTMNLCSAKENVLEYSREVFRDDLALMEKLPGQYWNFHPGSHLKQGYEVARDMIADAMNTFLTPEQTTIVLLETMAGKGTEVGRSFEELQGIIERIECSDRVGVCFDTCHVWDAGYDIVNDLDGVLAEFDRIIGLDRLKAVHLNDSKNERGSHKDRHEKLGQGVIGLEALTRVIRHPALQKLPFILETPNEDEGYREEIARVLQLQQE